MGATVVLDYETTDGQYVESVTVIKTEDDAYPSGWKYNLHYETLGGKTVIRYDNAHEQTKGHERHTPETTETVEFPGMMELYEQFQTEIEEQ